MPLLDLFWAMLWFFLFFAWIWLLISIFSDIFRSDDLSGWAKAFWTIFVVVLPLLGVLVYLIARGGSMQERAVAEMAAREKATRQYIQEVSSASGASTADELEKLGKLRDQGVLSPDEFNAQKAKLLA
ncbi:MAG TPA: SHOCT domain-containing protein [Acidimicrobiia bacterium]|nr:SHOCT domain-containing protein [Acidimicrobiia bacterium]